MGKYKITKIKNPDCKDPNVMLQNYNGLWRTLKVSVFNNGAEKAALKQQYGFMLKMGNAMYKLEA
jgi:hypothetical protein